MLRTAPLLLALTLSAIPCAQDEGSETLAPSNPKPAAAERYPFLYDVVAMHEAGPEAWQTLPYERLLLRRQGCFGPCPVYEVELRRDGTARYTGGAHAPRQGEFEGKVPLYTYGLLCAAAEDLDLEGMQGRYSAEWTDDENIAIEWERDARAGYVLDYARQAPPAFHAYRALFDELAAQIEWTPVEEKR
ncbi:MAG TPA: DUF6438 domain-containing protein [Planctomycetota bacterium]|nr:DUF6438 domain-containing protein [Planctomycetota bacterium]